MTRDIGRLLRFARNDGHSLRKDCARIASHGSSGEAILAQPHPAILHVTASLAKRSIGLLYCYMQLFPRKLIPRWMDPVLLAATPQSAWALRHPHNRVPFFIKLSPQTYAMKKILWCTLFAVLVSSAAMAQAVK